MANKQVPSALFLGKELAATFIDGAVHRVRVREVPYSRMHELFTLLTQEGPLIEFCTQVCTTPAEAPPGAPLTWEAVPAGWADNLSDASHLELVEAARAQNAFRARSWADRQVAARLEQKAVEARMAEAYVDAMQPILESRIQAILKNSLAALQSSSDATPKTSPGTGPARSTSSLT